MEGYRLFRKDRQGRQGGGVTLYVNDQLECMEFYLGKDEELTELMDHKRKWETWLPRIWRKLRYSTPSLPQPSLPSAPAIRPKLQKAKAGTGRMKNHPL